MGKHWGPDVSEFQGTAVDWAKVRAAGAAFAIARTSYGTNHTDKTFPVNAKGIKAAGLHRGAYIYCLPSQDPTIQAQKFVSDLKAVGYRPAKSVVEAFQGKGDLPPALDLESTAGWETGSANVHAWIHKMASEVETLIGVKPLFYTYFSWWNEHVGNCPTCHQHALWFASYPAHPDPTHPPKPPAPWAQYSLWQYAGSSVTIPGIPGKNDCSWLMLDIPNPAITVAKPPVKPAPKPPVPKPVISKPVEAPAPTPPVTPPVTPVLPHPLQPLHPERSTSMFLKSLVSRVVVFAKKEPVAVWGLAAGAVLNVLAPLLHMHAGQIQAVSTVLTLVGIPVVRSKVSPAQLASAAVKGAEARK